MNAQPDVTPLWKEESDWGTCPCPDERCPREGRIRKKVWKDGTRHVAKCPCPRCKGGRTTGNARRREHKVAKAARGKRNVASGAFGGSDVIGGVCDVEETAYEPCVRGLRRWWYSKAVQAKVATLMSRRVLPRAFVASWSGKPRLTVQPFEDWAELCEWAERGMACDLSCHEVVGKGDGRG